MGADKYKTSFAAAPPPPDEAFYSEPLFAAERARFVMVVAATVATDAFQGLLRNDASLDMLQGVLQDAVLHYTQHVPETRLHPSKRQDGLPCTYPLAAFLVFAGLPCRWLPPFTRDDQSISTCCVLGVY